MLHNTHCSAASQACIKTSILHLSLSKLPVSEVLNNEENPVNDEMKEQVNEKNIETQSENSQYLRISTPEPDISYRFFFHIQHTAEKMAENSGSFNFIKYDIFKSVIKSFIEFFIEFTVKSVIESAVKSFIKFTVKFFIKFTVEPFINSVIDFIKFIFNLKQFNTSI
ncbi:hypothetical protein BDBG_08759 [Blastomyces gilchristii SLH14081]|uniref:Uncharacterized protein n=1 Tax=Blastomyces gilchristii (strain SLH14081) TaxID=559298 RepID=A0A179UZV8_BLAGS|nr:uncharacterized protein BDBG_08759 [Blastomyces gilchristii SLH14081]OAT13585.1 hypothetical protein BDBG_08759 [Blastomyces gilchristii SLH14081]